MKTTTVCPSPFSHAPFRNRRSVVVLLLMALFGCSNLFPAETDGASVASGKIVSPVPTHRVSPRHPPELMQKLIEGSAMIECVVGEDGSVISVKTLSATEPEFGLAAEDAVRQWRFEPATKNGTPVAVSVHIPFEFFLTNEQVVEMVANRKVYEEVSDTMISAQELPSWPRPLEFIVPRYPAELEGTGKYGKAVISIVINKEGQVINPKLVKATYPEFVLPALVSAARLTFPPQVMADGVHIYVKMDVQFDFEVPRGKAKVDKSKPKAKAN